MKKWSVGIAGKACGFNVILEIGLEMLSVLPQIAQQLKLLFKHAQFSRRGLSNNGRVTTARAETVQ